MTSKRKKTCSSCKRLLPLSDFHIGGTKSGRASACKECRRAYYRTGANQPAVSQQLLDEALDSCLEQLEEIERDMLEMRGRSVAIKSVMSDLAKANGMKSMRQYKLLPHGSFRYDRGRLTVKLKG